MHKMHEFSVAKHEANGLYIQEFNETVVVKEVVSVERTLETAQLNCPLVVTPGEFFTCEIDIPHGSDVRVNVDLANNVTEETRQRTSWNWMFMPGKLLHCQLLTSLSDIVLAALSETRTDIPGGPLRLTSKNAPGLTVDPNLKPGQIQGVVLPSTKFTFVANVTLVFHLSLEGDAFNVDVSESKNQSY